MKIAFLFFISFNLWAANGNEVGNGGDGLICPNKSIVLFDFFEAEQLKRFKISYAQGKNWYEIAGNTFERLKSVSPALYKQYKRVLSGINERLVFVDKSNFRDIKDSFEVALPESCRLEQLAIQQDDSNGKRKVYISKKYWRQLDDEQKAGLITHEIIYEHFVNLGEKNSVKVRILNSLIHSKIKDNKYLSIELRKLKLPLY